MLEIIMIEGRGYRNKLKKKIVSMAMFTEETQGVPAVIMKDDGSTSKAFFSLDNGRILFKEEDGKTKNVLTGIRSIKI